MVLETFMGSNIVTRTLFFVALLIVVGDLLATIFAIIYQRFIYEHIMRPRYDQKFSPRCSVIIPCKGIPKDFEINIAGFLELDYPDFEVVYVVESESDPAVGAIKALTSKDPRAKFVVAGLTKKCAQKNHNLLAAVAVSDNPDVLVFADSDIRPRKQWLKELVLPFADQKVTVTSGFRWLHATNGTVGELTHSYVNVFMYVCFSVACYFGGVGLWGGSMAIRKRDFDSLGVAEKWGRTAVDDMSLSQIVMRKRKKAVLVTTCITHTDDLLQTVGTTVSWFERQIMFLKAYQKALWFMPTSIIVLLSTALLLSLPFALIGSLLTESSFFELGGGSGLLFFGVELMTALLYPFLGPMSKFHKFLILLPFMRLMQIVSYLRTWTTSTIIWAGISYRLAFSGDVLDVKRPDIV